jgi:YD repeat-containing protein
MNGGSLFRRVMVALFMLISATAWAGSASYTYDTLGRLTQVKYSNGVVIQYTYDAAGNRTTQVIKGAP